MAVYAVLAQDPVHPDPNLWRYVLVVRLAGFVRGHEYVKSVVDGQATAIVNPLVEMMSGDSVSMVPEKPVVVGGNYPFVVSACITRDPEGSVADRKEVGFEVLGRVGAIVRVLHNLMSIRTFHQLGVTHYVGHVVTCSGSVLPSGDCLG